MADIFMRMQWLGGGRSRSRNKDDNQLAAIFMLVGLVFSILAPIFAHLLEMAVSRQREYLADASAAELTRYPEGLANALRKVAYAPERLEVANLSTQHLYIVNPLVPMGSNSLFSSHPSTEERIRSLMGLAGAGFSTDAPPVGPS